MSITDQINLLELEKQNLKVNWFCKIDPHTFEYKWNSIEILSIENENSILKVWVKIDWKEDNYRFKNPPIMVPDWTFRDEILDWKTIQVHNFKEDLLESLHIMVWDTYLLIK